MALLKCGKCENMISEKARFCPNCGNENNLRLCPECNESMLKTQTICNNCGWQESQPKKTKKSMRLFLGIAFCIIGAISCFLSMENINYVGDYQSNEYYGGDAYTGIQHAAATTANNINELGDTIEFGLQMIFLVEGLVLITSGVYFIIVRDRY